MVYSHSLSCNFESVTLFSNSQYVLTTLSASLPYLIPKSLTDTQSLLNSLSDSKVVHLQWLPGHSSLLGNDLANTLAKVGATHDPSTAALSLSSLISSQRLSLHASWRRGIQFSFFQHQIPTVSFEKLTLSRSARYSFTLQRAQHSSRCIPLKDRSSQNFFVQQLWF